MGGKKRNKADQPGHADNAGGGKGCDQKDDQAVNCGRRKPYNDGKKNYHN